MRPIDALRSAAALAAAAWFGAAPAAACTVSATGVAFGAYNPISPAPDDGTGSIVVVCHPNEHGPQVALSAGNSGSFAARNMRNGSTSLNYNLYTSAARNVVWGNGSGGSATVTLSGGTVNHGQRTFTRDIFGRVPTAQHVAAGVYTDLIMVTVTF
jgi:spore coat protein U-like protein